VFIVQAYQTSKYMVPHGGIFLGKWRSSLAGRSGGRMKVQAACVLNIRYNLDTDNVVKETTGNTVK
jgi:hypothetical protein